MILQGWRKSDNFIKAGEYAFAGLIFFVLAIIPVYSLLSEFSHIYIGSGELQGWLWRYWWMKKLIASAAEIHPLNPWLVAKTALTAGNFPETGNIFDLLLFSMPLEKLFGAPLYYNIKVILILILNGFAGYAMCRYFKSTKAAALAGGAFLILNPYILYEISLGRIRQAILFAMPLFVIHLYETYRTGNWKNTILAGFWLGITSAFYLFYGMSLFFFLCIFVLYHLITKRKNFPIKFLGRGAVMMLVFAAVTTPFCLGYIDLALGAEGLPETRYGKNIPSLNVIMGKEKQTDLDSNTEASVKRFSWDSAVAQFPFKLRGKIYIPLVFTILILIPLLFCRPVPWVWIINLFFFAILAMGPYLKTAEVDGGYLYLAGKPVLMPYAFFYKYIPAFSRLFSPIRWMGFMSVAGALLVGLNLTWILNRLNSGLLKKAAFFTGAAAFLIITGLCIFQMKSAGTFPLITSTTTYPAIYGEIAGDSMTVGVFEVPMPPPEVTFYYQIYHQKRLPGSPTAIPRNALEQTGAGGLAEKPEDDLKPFIDWLTAISNDMPLPELTDENIRAVEKRGFEVIIVHERDFAFMYPDKGREHFNKAVGILKTKLIYSGNYEDVWHELEADGKKHMLRKAAIAVFRIPDREEYDDDSQE